MSNALNIAVAIFAAVLRITYALSIKIQWMDAGNLDLLYSFLLLISAVTDADWSY